MTFLQNRPPHPTIPESASPWLLALTFRYEGHIFTALPQT